MIREFKWVTFIVFIIMAILIRLFLITNESEVKEITPNDNPIQYIVVGEDDYELFYGEELETEVVEILEEPKVNNTTNSELEWLAKIIHAEAKGESFDGKLAVGNVVMNRVYSSEFPNTIEEVIFQKGQFSPVSDGSIWNEPSIDSIESATMVLNGHKVVGDEALFFYNPQIVSRGNWIRSRRVITEIGNHAFCE